MRDPAALLADLIAAGLSATLIAEIAELTVEVKWIYQRRAKDAERKRVARAGVKTEAKTPRPPCPRTSAPSADTNLPLSLTTSSVVDIRKKERERGGRGTRLDPNWVLPEEDRQFALQEGLKEREVVFEAAKFRDYWIAKAGAASVKLNWSCTWRNWVRNGIQRNGSNLTGFPRGGMAPRPGSREDRAERTTNALRRLGEFIDDRRGSSGASQATAGLLPLPKHS